MVNLEYQVKDFETDFEKEFENEFGNEFENDFNCASRPSFTCIYNFGLGRKLVRVQKASFLV
jgi:hypothetical protein